MLKKIYLFVFGLLISGYAAFAQNNTGSIKVLLKDKTNNEAIPFANVVAYQNGVQVGVGTTNMDGEVVIKPLSPGKYDVKGVYVGYQASETKGVVVGEGKTVNITIALSNGEGVKLDEVEVVAYQVPLIDPDTKSGGTVTREDYQNMATKDINSVAATTAGVFQSDEGKGLNVRGARDGATTYFVDGIKVIGGLSGLPQQSIEQINVITGGLPAMYGDATSGVISVTTRGPQAKFFGGVELISSQITDPYGYNSLGFSMGGPIISKTDSTGRKTPIVGFFLSGQGYYIKDPSPSGVPVYKLKDDKLKEIQEAPLVPSRSGSGYVKAAEFLTSDDFQTIKAHQNIAQRQIALNGKIDIKASPNTNITLGGAYDYSNLHNFIYAYSLYNPENNPQTIANHWRAYARVTQKFGNSNEKDKDKTQSVVNNAFFSFLASYENSASVTQDDTHKDKFFDYGYIGKFTRTYTDKMDITNYQFNPKLVVGNDTVKAYAYAGRREVNVAFQPSDLNYTSAQYTSYLYNQLGTIPTLNTIAENGGLRNGDQPNNGFLVYNLWSATGSQYPTYTKSNQSRARVAASFNADIKNNAITVGVEYDQSDQRFFQVNDATALWTRMRLLSDAHLQNLDLNNPILVPELSGTYPAYYYNNKYDSASQSEFSIKLLEKLGLPKNYTKSINVDELDPSTFSLNMFSAEDLLGQNSGSALVDYYGYDYKGNRTNKVTNLNDFLNQVDAYGKHTLPVGSFRPIYMAGYIQDNFQFRDIRFNIGLRIDRYDANQKTLKDIYSVYETKTVGETGSEFNHPSNMGSDYVVYTSNYTGGSVVGYRHNDTWYDAKGNELSDPTLLLANTGSGKLTPYLKHPEQYANGIRFSADAFANYKAQINAMPRIAFSFPISDVANFFAHYDMLTQRPGGNRLDPKDYYFLQSESSTPFLANPNLRPSKTTDYEFGYSQILNERKNASLTITTFYKEMRDMLTQKQIVGAFPRNYITYVNQDFGTSKGISVIFDMRRSGGSRINANYTLQFAEGSGSNANSGANLANSGQPNLRVTQPLDYDQRHNIVLTYDYRFGSGKDYHGPELKRKEGNPRQILKDIGFNLTWYIGSGTPYTRWSAPVAIGSNVRSNIAGSLNGSYKPWTIRGNLRIDKTIQLTWGKKEGEERKKANLNIYLQVLNLLNSKNILGVYNFTGNPNDDGYLSSPLAQSTIQSLNSPTGYVNQYTINMNNPSNYGLPRQIRIGLQLDF
ncbi:MAG: carboxypeptidase regulatory-like domain-containing protein [Mucilaginibacter sp.]